MYINNFSDNLEFLTKKFADDTSLKLVNRIISGKCLLTQIFNLLTKQAKEVIFSRKSKKKNHSTVYYNDSPVAHTNCQKHLGMYLDKKINFLQNIKEKISEADRGNGVIRKLIHILPRHSLITIYK